ncbi:MAG: DUF2095 family protein [Promethearchaeota archaeon]
MGQKKERPKAVISEDKLTVEYDIKEFQDSLPNLSSELTSSKDTQPDVVISGVKFNETPQDPKIVDFFQRCETEAQALEILSYMNKQGEISDNEASEMKHQLKSKGVRSFGPRKTSGHYERAYRR